MDPIDQYPRLSITGPGSIKYSLCRCCGHSFSLKGLLSDIPCPSLCSDCSKLEVLVEQKVLELLALSSDKKLLKVDIVKDLEEIVPPELTAIVLEDMVKRGILIEP